MKQFKNTHIHHKIPKHMGGSDDPSNLVELSIAEHAEAHRILYEQYGLKQDEIAWKMLSGQISSDQARRMDASLIMKTKVGEKNSQWGAKWYNNGSEEKKIRINEL